MKERLAQFYQNGMNGFSPSISIDGILKAVSNGLITLDDAIEIVGDENTVEIIRAAKLKEISAACNAVIVNGIDLELSKGVVHFNLSIEDQSNIANLFRVVELGGTEFPYQADGGVCRIYTAAEIAQIYIAAQGMITSQTTYHNSLKSYIMSLENAEEIAAVTYGMELPDPYLTEMNEKLAVAQAQMETIIERLNKA